MTVDRDETLKKAEKLLKQGHVAGAIDEYVRLVEDRPADWNLANTLGDLFVKAGDTARAAAEFTRVADHLYGEGFFPRAAAVYKKVLKVRHDDDHAIWQLADIAGRQGLGVDARSHYRRLIRDRRAAGNERGAIDCLVRLGQLEDADIEARTVAARALIDRGEPQPAARLFAGVAELLTKEGRLPEALDALSQAAELDPGNQEIQDRLEAARPVSHESPPEVTTVEGPAEVTVETASEATVERPPEVTTVDDDPPAVLAEVVAAPEPVAAEPLILESIFEELTDRVAREQEERERQP